MSNQDQTTLTIEVKQFQGDQVEEFTFEQELKVGEAVETIVEAFDADAIEDPSLFHDDERLEDNRTLVSYQLDGETVILAASTTGV